MILDGRGRRDPLAVVFVDFSKAFDSMSHEHILCALQQTGGPACN